MHQRMIRATRVASVFVFLFCGGFSLIDLAIRNSHVSLSEPWYLTVQCFYSCLLLAFLATRRLQLY